MEDSASVDLMLLEENVTDVRLAPLGLDLTDAPLVTVTCKVLSVPSVILRLASATVSMEYMAVSVIGAYLDTGGFQAVSLANVMATRMTVTHTLGNV